MRVIKVDIDNLSKFFNDFWFYKEFSIGLWFLGISFVVLLSIPISIILLISGEFIFAIIFPILLFALISQGYIFYLIAIRMQKSIFRYMFLIFSILFLMVGILGVLLTLVSEESTIITSLPFLATILYSYMYMKAFRVIGKIDLKEQYLMSEYWKNFLESKQLFFESIGIPYAFVKNINFFKKIFVYILFNISILLYAIAFLSPYIYIQVSFDFMEKNPNLSEHEIFFNFILLITIVLILAIIINTFTKYIIRMSVLKLKEKDKRPHIVYLRAFTQDKYFLPYNSFIKKFISYIRGNIKIDSIMLEECSAIGPVIALGDPKDKISPYGVSRHYAKDDEWQDYIYQILDDAKMIYMFLDGTDGVAWEVEQLISMDKLKDTIFILSPKSKTDDVLKYFSIIASHKSVMIDSQEKENIIQMIKNNELIGFFITGINDFILLEGKDRNWTSYLLAVRSSLRLRESTYNSLTNDLNQEKKDSKKNTIKKFFSLIIGLILYYALATFVDNEKIQELKDKKISIEYKLKNEKLSTLEIVELNEFLKEIDKNISKVKNESITRIFEDKNSSNLEDNSS